MLLLLKPAWFYTWCVLKAQGRRYFFRIRGLVRPVINPDFFFFLSTRLRAPGRAQGRAGPAPPRSCDAAAAARPRPGPGPAVGPGPAAMVPPPLALLLPLLATALAEPLRFVDCGEPQPREPRGWRGPGPQPLGSGCSPSP